MAMLPALLSAGENAIRKTGTSTLANLIGNEVIGATGKALAANTAKNLGTQIAVNAISKAPATIAVDALNKATQYRGISANSMQDLLGIVESSKNSIPTTYTGGQTYGNGAYFFNNPEDAKNWAVAHQPGEYKAVLAIDRPLGSYINYGTYRKNRSDFMSRLDAPGNQINQIADAAFNKYMDKNGVTGYVGNNYEGRNPVYVVKNPEAMKNLRVSSVYTPDTKDWAAVEGDLQNFVKQNNLEAYLGEPNINYSLAEEPGIPIYHGTENKFEDFDDRLPSAWFSDSNKHLGGETGRAVKSGRETYIVERILPKDLKLATPELEDRFTRQQLIDRGYDGIAYPESGPNLDETYYEIFKPNKTLKKVPKVSQSLGYGGYGSYDENVKRIGSSAVAPVREETLPEGWKELEKYLDTSNDRLSLAIGKPRSKITKQDLINFLEDYGYDTEGTKDDLWKNALECIDDMAVDDLYNAGSSAGQFLQNRLPFRHSDTLTDATNYYIGAKGRTGRLDAEYSDRLGIGRSNTPMSDRLVNPYSGAGGNYAQGAFGTDATWSTGESGVSTAAHERMHAWQDINKFDWDEEVGDAIDELRGELKKFYHDEDAIKKYWGNSKTDYYMEDIEQEARMLQSYLDNEGYTNTYRKTSDKGTEWGDEVKPAFDKFFKKLRELSKKGIALPAIAGLVGIGTLSGQKEDKKLDNIE